MNRLKKRLTFLLAAVLLFALVAPAAPEVTAFAATKNPITELGIGKLPEGNTIKVGDVYNFNPEIIATERGKGKTTGLVWWEVNVKTNTAGVSSSRWGYVYPVYAGSFEIRALAFASTKDLNAWKAARSANGKVADEAATAGYVTAMTDWVKIDVVSDTEGYAVARTQYQLGLALKNTKATDIHIVTDKAVKFTIASRNYTRRTLTVDAPNAEVENAGRFAQINIQQIKASTFTEKAYGNRFYVTAPDARIVFLNNARTSEIVFEPEKTAETKQLTLVGEGGTLSELNVRAAGKVDIVGDIFANRIGKAVVVNVAEEAAGTSIWTDAALEVNAAADVAVTVNHAAGSEVAQDAPKTVINMEKAAKVSVNGIAADGTTVVVKGEAKGSEVASDAALVIVADADVSLNLSGSAAGTTVTKGENVKVELSAESKVDGVSVTDVNGTVETIKPGEDSPEVTAAPSATPTPVPTTTPSGGSSSGGSTPSYPVVPSTPTPTPTPTSGASYTLDGKSTGVSFESGSKEAVVALPADSSSKMVTLAVNGSSVQKVLAVGVNTVSVGEYTVKFIVPLTVVEISASLSNVEVSSETVTGSAVLAVKVKDDLSAFTSDSDFVVSYEWKVGDALILDASGALYQKMVEVAVDGNIITYAETESYLVVVKVNHIKTGEVLVMQSNALEVDLHIQREESNKPGSWLEVEYKVPEFKLFKGYFTMQESTGMAFPTLLVAEDDWKVPQNEYMASFGWSCQDGLKYVFAYEDRYYPIKLVSFKDLDADGNEFIVIYAAPEMPDGVSRPTDVFYVDSLEEAWELADEIPKGIDVHYPFNIDGKAEIYYELYDQYNNSWFLTKDKSGHIWRENIDDLLLYGMKVYTFDPVVSRDAISVKQVDELFDGEGNVVGVQFLVEWDLSDSLLRDPIVDCLYFSPNIGFIEGKDEFNSQKGSYVVDYYTNSNEPVHWTVTVGSDKYAEIGGMIEITGITVN